MTRDWKGERDYWLAHYAQHRLGQKRYPSGQTITENNYIAIPIPLNTPTPLAFHSLIWRWGVSGGDILGHVGG